MAVRVRAPWGWHQVLAAGPHWQVKLLHVNAGHRTSLQKHRHRSEDWHLLEGVGLFTVGDKQMLAEDVGWVHVYANNEHRISGYKPKGLTILELQCSPEGVIEEADITRTEDDYHRTDD